MAFYINIFLSDTKKESKLYICVRCHKVQMARHGHTLCSVNAKHTRGVLTETHFEHNYIE